MGARRTKVRSPAPHRLAALSAAALSRGLLTGIARRGEVRVEVTIKARVEPSPDGGQWALTRDSKPGMSDMPREAALEAASGDLRFGHDVVSVASVATDRGGKPIKDAGLPF